MRLFVRYGKSSLTDCLSRRVSSMSFESIASRHAANSIIKSMGENSNIIVREPKRFITDYLTFYTSF
jgi:hypothetical protein